MENWKPITGYEDRYEVSNVGRVRSLPIPVVSPNGTQFFHPLSGRILSQSSTRRGYKQIMLHTGVKAERRTAKVHRLVCEAFNGPPPEGKPHVLHGDGDPANNVVSNLRWGSHSENIKEAVAHGVILAGENNARARLSDDDVAAIRELRKQGASYKDLAQRYGVHWCYIQKLVLGARRAIILP